MYYYTALVTLGSVIFYGYLGVRVALARKEFAIQAPAVTGHPIFERSYRVQMNTLEWLPIHLCGLWLFAIYVSDAGAAVLGLIWIAGRTIYARAYVADPGSRATGFTIQLVATALLCLGAIGDIVVRIALGD
jgi:glutathione S-transferase